MLVVAPKCAQCRCHCHPRHQHRRHRARRHCHRPEAAPPRPKTFCRRHEPSQRRLQGPCRKLVREHRGLEASRAEAPEIGGELLRPTREGCAWGVCPGRPPEANPRPTCGGPEARSGGPWARIGRWQVNRGDWSWEGFAERGRTGRDSQTGFLPKNSPDSDCEFAHTCIKVQRRIPAHFE